MYHLKCAEKDVAKRAITCGDPGRAMKIASLLDGSRLVNDNRGLLTYTGNYNGERVTVATTGMGAPSAAIVCEELAMLGVKAMIRVGTTGGIAKDINLGDIVVPTEAIPLDGATQAYMKLGAEPLPDEGVVDKLKAVLERRGIMFHLGPICTSDTFYLEEERDAERWMAKGVLCFEMECSVTFAIGSLRGYRAGALLTVTGTIHGEGERVLDPERAKESINCTILTALDAVSSVELG